MTMPTPSTAGNGVTLSICIPTYNRARFLEHLFPQIKAWGESWDFSYEVVVSDNHSTDDTPDVVERHRAEGLPIRYFRQEENKVLFNLISVFHRAEGQYVLYLADDDLLIPEAVADNIHFMMANPEIRACYTPWEVYDDLNKTTTCLFYHQPDDLKVFKPGEEASLLGYVVEHHIFPEIVIYRADAARQIAAAPRFCYWAFSYIAGVIAEGPVAFRRVPYFRSVTLTPVMPERTQAGMDDAMTIWDNYRGGIEYMIFSLLRRHNLALNGEMRQAFRDMVDVFVETRMRVALRLWLQRKDFIRAYEIICRLTYLDPRRLADFEHMDQLPVLVMAQTLARFANGVAGIDRLLVSGVDDGQALGQLLRDVGLERRILVLPPPAEPTQKTLAGSIVFVPEEAQRQGFLDQGYAPGLVVSERDIRQSVLL
ncbi:glycosyltransferase family 2 protein [Aquabacter sp. L1I39]|uniref:glycosyltransferase family 2 protein n=1 Tax=Aquabacter sp. L1I39 TaxID=2820278 RepID=UPI001ADAE213|nr:glycosyltransferase family 2 protein [Aquabacter sp. L1I39]QTL04129.1 glycosyltransferase family 2 protein [Aquabacter sp. L1I39]